MLFKVLNQSYVLSARRIELADDPEIATLNVTCIYKIYHIRADIFAIPQWKRGNVIRNAHMGVQFPWLIGPGISWLKKGLCLIGCVIMDPSAFLAETHPTLSLIGCLYWLGCLGEGIRSDIG